MLHVMPSRDLPPSHDTAAAPDYQLLEDVIDNPRRIYWELLREFHEELRPMPFLILGQRIISACARVRSSWAKPIEIGDFKAPKDAELPAFPPTVGALAGVVWTLTGLLPDRCQVTLYRDGDDFVEPHVDMEGVTGPRAGNVVIPIFSFGEPRLLMFRRLDDPEQCVPVTLHPGSLFIMRGDTQRFWTHEIPKSDDKHPRLSVTFIFEQQDPPEKLAWMLSRESVVLGAGPKESMFEQWFERYDAEKEPLTIVAPDGRVMDVPPKDFISEHWADFEAASATRNVPSALHSALSTMYETSEPE